MPALDVIGKGPSLVTVADYTTPALIVPELRERDPAGVISELSQILQRHGCVPDVLPFYHAALNQEMLTSSAVDSGLAFPHARLKGVKQLQFAIGRTRQPVIWGSKGSLPVQIVFLFAVPATDAAPYLQLLAGLARLGQHPDKLAELLYVADSVSMFAVLKTLQMRHE